MFDEFHSGCLPLHNLNFGTITLLPKAKEVKQIQQYRPICLLNVSFKVFIKVLANRTNAVVNKIVSPSQTFMSSRNNLEGVVILYETLHELRKKKLSGVVLKLDFEKAYDEGCDWIKKVVSKGNVNVKVNDDLGHYFQTKKGVRQGDPLSPFLFNLIADMLATLISRGKANGQFRGVIPHLVEGDLSILQYADDTILFLEHDLAEAVSKSIFTKARSSFLERQNYRRKNTGSVPFQIPGHSNAPSKNSEQRLGGNRRKILKKIGKLEGQTALCWSLPMFMFSFFETPKGVIKKLDYYRSRFFCQSDEHKMKYSVLGIGILDLELQNKCLLSKWLYKLLNEDGAWQELIKKKYLHHKSITQVSKKPGDSQFWSGLMGVRNQFLSFGSFRTQKWSMCEKTLIEDNLVSWYELVSKVANISLAKGNDEFRWDLNKGEPIRSLPRNSKLWKLKIPLKDKNFLMVIYRATYWIRCWSALCKEEERGKLKLGCQHLESVVLKLFFNFGWQR
ncbi:hypothetical protein U9M48_020086, partial [Paspalum notatum var. saurae]